MAYVLLVKVQSRGFALVPELIMICAIAIMILIKQTRDMPQKYEVVEKQIVAEKNTIAHPHEVSVKREGV